MYRYRCQNYPSIIYIHACMCNLYMDCVLKGKEWALRDGREKVEAIPPCVNTHSEAAQKKNRDQIKKCGPF